MAETAAALELRIQAAMVSGFRARLLDKGQARGLIWRDGELPPESPAFADALTDDLLDYGHTLLAMALRLRRLSPESAIHQHGFRIAGEAIEAAVHRGTPARWDRGFHQVTAAVAFHLARYAARAYSVLPTGVLSQNLSPAEKGLVHLLRRSLDELHGDFSAWLLNKENKDDAIAARLANDEEAFDDADAVHVVLTTVFMRGMALFDHALVTGDNDSAGAARTTLEDGASAAADLRAVPHWWALTLAAHLVDELWNHSLHHRLPTLAPDDVAARWNSLRRDYIQRLRAGRRAAIELWPSQAVAARRAIDSHDDLVVALPTSGGKSRIAELCILRALASEKRIFYVTPLRALSAQVERDLAETFSPLGVSVSSLYGSAGIESGDAETLREGTIVVATPEKIDFAVRSDPSIIDDVGLVVLDEAHMLGPKEREVRYEALVQRLLRRVDADERRIVCLSALFPEAERMSDLVAWIRRDQPGDPVHSLWRPTRQRFGVVRWEPSGARLEVKVEGESPFVPRFVEVRPPPEGSSRRREFPNPDSKSTRKNELTLAVAWKFVGQDKDVLIYCVLRTSVETLGRLAIRCIEQGLLSSLRTVTPRIKDAIAIGAEWLGADHPSVECLQHGIILHHGGLPRPFLNALERVLRAGDCSITIASPTLAQGLNLSASVLLVPSIWRNQETISPMEFANVAGRAGRAFVDLEGLVLHIVWEPDRGRGDWAVRKWKQLVAQARAPVVESGILQLSYLLMSRIAQAGGVPLTEALGYVTGQDGAWDFSDVAAQRTGIQEADWERDIASLDAAILGLLDVDTEDVDVGRELDVVLDGSLFSRQLEQQEEAVRLLLRGFVAARAQRIWSRTTRMQRKGYHVAGLGLRAGQFLDENLVNLVARLSEGEAGIAAGDEAGAVAAVLAFAEIAFQTPPFQSRELRPAWKDMLSAWLQGRRASEVIHNAGEDAVDLLQDALTYRLPWAMEAVRVHAVAVGHAGADELQGLAAMAVEIGSTKPAVITLLRAGLSSREAAQAAVASTGASFGNRTDMMKWLRSKEVQELSKQEAWPTPEGHAAWREFLDAKQSGDRRKWHRETQTIRVNWTGAPQPPGTPIVIETPGDQPRGTILTPSYEPLGQLRSALKRPRRDIVGARVGLQPDTVVLEFFGPRAVR